MTTCLVVDDSGVIRKIARRMLEHALAAGANEYIMKPFDKDIVAAKFQEVGLVAVPV